MESLEEKHKISLLLDLYGGLLAERQRAFLKLHVNEDLSYGEIAEAENISRQAVHDAIQHGKKTLNRFEGELKLLENGRRGAMGAEHLRAAKAAADEILRMIRDDILYDTQPVRKKILRLRELIDAALEAS